MKSTYILDFMDKEPEPMPQGHPNTITQFLRSAEVPPFAPAALVEDVRFSSVTGKIVCKRYGVERQDGPEPRRRMGPWRPFPEVPSK